MNQKEIEDALNAHTIGDRIIAYDTLARVATLHLQVMKSGVPKLEPILVDIGVGNIESQYENGWNACHNLFTAYLAQQEAERRKKLAGLEEVIIETESASETRDWYRKVGLDADGIKKEREDNLKRIQEVATAIRKHLGVEC